MGQRYHVERFLGEPVQLPGMGEHMTHDELRRLTIRLARHIDREGDGFCDECYEYESPDGMRHTPDCPIAALEAEEAKSKLRPVEPKRNPENEEPGFIRNDGVRTIILTGDGWSKVNMLFDGHQRPCWMQMGSIEVKPAGEFEGEFEGEF